MHAYYWEIRLVGCEDVCNEGETETERDVKNIYV